MKGLGGGTWPECDRNPPGIPKIFSRIPFKFVLKNPPMIPVPDITGESPGLGEESHKNLQRNPRV